VTSSTVSTVCVTIPQRSGRDIVPEGVLPKWDRGLALRAVALGRGASTPSVSTSVDSAWQQRKLEAKSLSKYDQCTLNPFPNFNVVFGDREAVRRMAAVLECVNILMGL
jgi:hypothetical protein